MVGSGRAPSTEDKLRMPYTNAVIHELQRFHKTRIENFPRMTTQDVLFRGYSIPKVHPHLCAPRDSSDICLCPGIVCTRLKVPALSQPSGTMTFPRGAGTGEWHCSSCPHPVSLPCPPWERAGARPKPGAHPGVGPGQTPQPWADLGTATTPGVTTSIEGKTHPEGTCGFGAVSGAWTEITAITQSLVPPELHRDWHGHGDSRAPRQLWPRATIPVGARSGIGVPPGAPHR